MKQLAETFWNLRGVYRVGGVLDIGTHMSIVRRPDGRYVVIDGCALDEPQRRALMALTGDGALVDGVVHVHPFHTLHVEATHRLFPAATLYGTARHRRKAPSLPWAGTPVEEWSGDHPLADVFDLSVPDGVDFVCPDDTLNVMAGPGILRRVLPQSSLRMHPMLSKGLTPKAGAADAYAAWAQELATQWADTRIVCAAHSAVRRLPDGGFAREMHAALARVSRTLERHRARYG